MRMNNLIEYRDNYSIDWSANCVIISTNNANQVPNLQ